MPCAAVGLGGVTGREGLVGTLANHANMSSYVPVLLMAATAFGIAVLVVCAPAMLGPRSPSRLKRSPYECGLPPLEGVRHRFPVRFYTVAVLFMLFDVELIFLYPWAAWFTNIPPHMSGLRLLGFIEMAVFMGLLAVGYLYVWRRGGLDWE